MKKILIIGATSAIAAACARLWAAQGAGLFLVARDEARLEDAARDLRVRGATAVHCHRMDATDTAGHEPMIDAAVETLGGLDSVLIAHGTLPDQQACEKDAAMTLEEFATNATSTIALLTVLADRLELQRSGAIGVITSVAGDRGRPGNYVYGSAKAAVSVFCEGLRARLFSRGVSVTDIRPGFVDTPMTRGLALPEALLARPEEIAPRIVQSIERRRGVVYVPAFWWLIMFVIRSLPAAVFNRLKL